ncbi:FYVE zinc finger-domain-containing protein [Collybia nuda]|uniref:FYVE zinc finger-domain-containing protein n=1 Tax=Collybia nuda TaxID=64659 RepID=A0A9P5XS39_9AGAR|nr:FYVE zinc finger-domain-containing protein [Collybia nuda]
MSALTTSRPSKDSLRVSTLLDVVPLVPDVPLPTAAHSSGKRPPSPPPSSTASDDSRAVSPDSCYSPLPSLTHSSPSSSSSSLHSVPERTNEHLAVLLPKHLWKPDSLASQCDNFFCGVKFSIFDRRHHCRKCGGVFCNACTSRETPLLDASNLSFIHPPRNVPLTSFASPISPITPSRVCDDCWDQVHGTPSTPRTPDLIRPSFSRMLSSPVSMLKSPLSASPTTSHSSSLSSSLATAPAHPLASSDTACLLATAAPIARKTRSLRNTPSTSSLNSNRRITLRAAHLTLPPDLERSYGELDAYPLKRSSVLCKATGGGRWEPKQEPALVGYRPPVPGAKAAYELEIEEQEREEKVRKANPIVRDGAFQYRFTREPEPTMISRTPFTQSTF